MHTYIHACMHKYIHTYIDTYIHGHARYIEYMHPAITKPHEESSEISPSASGSSLLGVREGAEPVCRIEFDPLLMLDDFQGG
jgi:hypothetical protein